VVQMQMVVGIGKLKFLSESKRSLHMENQSLIIFYILIGGVILIKNMVGKKIY
jgi:hypothetical protein